MKILAVDASTIVATCAILDEDKILSEHILNYKLTHSEKIMPMIKEVLNSCGLKPKDIDVYAASKGPGSFTGLRIGIATIKGLAHVADKPVVGVSTLEALAYNMPLADGIVVPIMDARRNRVYTGMYKWVDGRFETVNEEMAIEVTELIDMLKDVEEKIIFNGNGTLVYKDQLKEALGGKAVFAPASVNMARASSVAQIAMMKAKEGKVESYYSLVPNYLRKSQAERQYEERKRKDGEK
ncbi:tRNA (adenosine(37)-N6)-threonylcarbamoyltransferase complex dimerization subunit type 1 TsaB [Caldisalinibacter kiritimatiensis]|uniref:Putative molecular chaperone n=1 Tax=Caldisalinibacter kiritimatiensis TaxID=1304284 RepID=R1CNY2_9FIRM|nr:tRNA (adenosine(37)-N6)-threonylcarbamoyltransferase complex dimerization subunit type 1 TsaB [Caldisalinibacter kiritimatiensis]EOD00406.1 Putative molecular chaperone [Caldisalinibacter kiritimatiensis]